MSGGHEKKPGGSSRVHDKFDVVGKRGSQPQLRDERKVGGSSLVHDTFGVIGPSGASTAPVLSDGEAVQRLTRGIDSGPPVPIVDAGFGGVVAAPGAAAPVQRSGGGPADEPSVQQAAAQGVAGAGEPLPHRAAIQQLFGRHDVSGVQAHVGGAAATASRAIGAEAYATGSHVAFAGAPSLHTAAHEAAHVVQQRGGVQLKGGVGAAGDPYERHADAVADAVVAGRSAESLLDSGAAGGGSTHAVQRKEASDDATMLANQASLKGTDVEIPALEGALLATRQEAVKRGLLSPASFSAGLALSQAMTQLQPAVAAKGPVDKGVQESAAVAAQRLYASLQHETADEKNFKVQPAMDESPAITSQNPYTNESRLTTAYLISSRTTNVGSWFEKLPALIRQGQWDDAFRGYRSMIDGLDLWVADQLRAKGKGTPEEALGNAHQHYGQLRTGLEAIADKHAKRLPALFHPDAKTIASEKAAGHPTADAIPLNVYFWKDAKDSTYHLYDLTTPGYPREQTIDGEPTAARMNTFFEEVARYPEGNVQYTLPSGAGGVAPTTGKIKWYEWVGYAGMAVAAVGLAALTAGASIPATVCFAAGALAGGISAVGHLADSARFGTATTTTVVIDIAQIVASFASFGAMSITVKVGGAAARSGYFVSLVGGAAAGDVVQLVALSKETVDQLDVINRSHGTADDQQRASSVLIAQLMVTTGLTALSVQGARNLRVPHGPPLELVEQNGVKMLRVAGEVTPEPIPHTESSVKGAEHGATAAGHRPVAHDTSVATGTKSQATGGDPGGAPATGPKAATSHLPATTSDSPAPPPASRVERPGGHPELLKALDTKAALDPKYTNDARFDSLAADPDHAGKFSPNSLQEAMAGLEAESRGLMKGPIERGPPGIEFYDAAGHPWDVKKPPSPPPGANWKFSLRRAAKSIREQLQAKFPNKLTGAPEPVRVLLDSSYMTAADHAALWTQLHLELSPDELALIKEFNTIP